MNERIFDTKSIILITSALLNFFVFLYLIFNRSRGYHRSKKHLSLATLGVSIWIFSSWINHFTDNVFVVTFFSRLSYSTMVLTLVELILFTTSFRYKIPAILIRSIGTIIFAFTQFSDLVIFTGIPAKDGVTESAEFGMGFQLWSFIMLLLTLFLIMALISVLFNAKGVQKTQFIIIFTLFVFSISLVIFFNLILPNLGINSFYYIGQYSTFIFALGSAWVIVQEKIYSIKYLLSNILSLLTAGIVLFLLSWGTQKFEQLVLRWDITKLDDIKIFIFGLIIACIVAIFIEKLLPLIRIFFYNFLKVSYESLYKINEWLIDRSNNNIDIKVYIGELVHNFNKALSSKDVVIYIHPLNEYYSENKLQAKVKDKIKNYTYQTKALSFDDNYNHPFSLYFPITNEKELLGVVVFLHKKNYGFYSKEEITQIFKILKILKMAMNRYLLYEQQKKFNETLEVSIKKATKELDKKNKMLARNLQYERDIIDILGHELRTPLTIARNAIALNKNLLTKEKGVHPKIVEYTDMAKENIDREIMTLETLLAVTKIDNNKMEINFEKVDLLDVINDSFAGLEGKAKDKGLKLINNLKQIIYIKADRAKIQEISDNLIDNAIKYTEKGSVSVDVKEEDTKYILTITDTGIGISKEELKHLGKKFYRVNNYIRSGKKEDLQIVRPGGTGLGLYVTFTLINLMEGKYEVNSKLGEGTCFTLTFEKWKDEPNN